MGLKSGLYGRRKRKPAYKNTEIELTADQKVSQFFEKTRNKLIDQTELPLRIKKSQNLGVNVTPNNQKFSILGVNVTPKKQEISNFR